MAARTAPTGPAGPAGGGAAALPPGAGSPTRPDSPRRDDSRTGPDSRTAARPSPLPLTERQEARRRRILDATTGLACRGGFDAVQMRAVAETSGVALGTLYRYFPSKIHLLVATMEDQLELLHLALRERPPAAGAPSERVVETLLRAFRALQREPKLADAMVRALIFADRSVSGEVAAVSRLTSRIIVDAMGPSGPGRDRGPDGGRLAAVRVIEHTWHAALVGWLSGRATVAQVTEDIRTVCALLDRPRPRPAAPAPAGG